MRNNFKVLLLFLIIALLFLTESQRQATAVISDESEQQLGPSRETATRSIRIPRGKGRCRLLRRRQRCVKWCTARMKAKEIDKVDWKKMFAGTVFIIGLVHIVYFCHPICHQDRGLG